MNPGTTSDADDVADGSDPAERPATRSVSGESDDATEAVEEATTAPADPVDADLPLDLVFTVLKNQRRRDVLTFLRDEDGPVSMSDLSELIAAKENDTTRADLGSRERKRVYVGLYQCHLPMMDDAGIVDFDKDRGDVELEDVASTFYSYLETPTASPRPWHVYYLAVALLGAVAVMASVVVPAFPAALIGGLLAAGVGGLALLHGWREETHRHGR